MKRVFRTIVMQMLLAAMVFSTGCAYFNSFYNTKKYFETAEKKRLVATEQNPRPAEYTKSIEAGSRLIEFYPNSKYIDDTLFLMGQSYYRLGDYIKARRKFEELQSNYPNSPFYEPSRLWLGKTFVKLKKRQEATSILRGLIGETQKPDLISGAQYALAELYFDDSLFVKSEQEFMKVADLPGSDDVIGEAYWRAGDAAFRVNHYDDAAKHFRDALRHKLSRSLIFQVKLLHGQALRLGGHPDKALGEFNSLLSDKRFYESHGPVRIEKALALHDLGKTDQAEAELLGVIDTYPRTESSSQAYYYLGLWSLKNKGDVGSARKYLDKSKVERSRSLYALKSDTLLTQLERVESLNRQRRRLDLRIQYIEKWLANPVNPADTTSRRRSTYYDKAAFDSLGLNRLFLSAWAPDTTSQKGSTSQASVLSYSSKPVLDTLAAERGALQTVRFHLGELLLFDMGERDSALSVFWELTRSSGIDSVRARAWLALAYAHKMQGDTTRHDSLLAMIANEYPSTRFGVFAAEKLGLISERDRVPRPDEAAYREAVSLYADENQHQEAYTSFRYLIDRYPTSPFIPSALYAAALISARDLGDIETSEQLLDQLTKDYSATPQGQQANMLLASLQEIRDRESSDSLNSGKGDAQILAEDDVDQKPVIVGGLQTLSSVLDSRNLLPQEVLQGAGGDVLLRYIVNADGSASHFRVVLEDPPGRGLARALISGLQLVDFAPALKDGKKVAARVERRFSLPLDAPPNIRPLPKRRGA